MIKVTALFIYHLGNGGEVSSSFSPIARQVEHMGCVWSPDYNDNIRQLSDDDGDDGVDNLLVITDALLGAQRGN